MIDPARLYTLDDHADRCKGPVSKTREPCPAWSVSRDVALLAERADERAVR